MPVKYVQVLKQKYIPAIELLFLSVINIWSSNVYFKSWIKEIGLFVCLLTDLFSSFIFQIFDVQNQFKPMKCFLSRKLRWFWTCALWWQTFGKRIKFDGAQNISLTRKMFLSCACINFYSKTGVRSVRFCPFYFAFCHHKFSFPLQRSLYNVCWEENVLNYAGLPLMWSLFVS